MKMKKQLAVLIAIILLLPAFPLYAEASPDFVITNGVLLRYNGTAGNVTVPNTVTAIGDGAFGHNSFINRVVLPASVRMIGDNAFSDSSLTSIEIGSGVTSIGRDAFKNCYGLRGITIPDSVTTIGDSAFENCVSLSSLTLGSGLRSIGASAFAMCVEIKTVNIPRNLASIGAGAFSGCVELQNFVVPQENTAFTAIDGVLYSITGRTLVAYPQARAGAYSLNPGTLVIAGGAFSYALDLTGLANTQDVETVGEFAFYGCVSLRSIWLPKAKSIGDYAFTHCQSLKTARVGGANIGRNVFAGCIVLNTVIVGSGSRSISHEAFAGCPELTDVMLPSSIDYMGSGVFSESPKARVLCNDGSVPHDYARRIARIPTVPLPVPSAWAVEPLRAAERFAVANLQTNYQANATRYAFTIAAVNFVEQYYGKGIDAILKERALTPGSFSDTDDADILAANALGIVAGSGGMFNPDRLLTREEAAALVNNIIVRVLGLDNAAEDKDPASSKYGDADSIASWALDAVSVVTEKGIMSGDGTNFNPKQPYTHEMCIITFLNFWNAVKN
jgi:hypothetical protein